MQDEVVRLADYRGMFAFQTQKKPPRFRPVPLRAAAPFPGTKFAEVRGYTFRFDDGRLRLDSCVIAPDGTLCPSVNVHGKTLSADQVERLLAIVPELSKEGRALDGEHAIKRPASHCQFNPHHAFVFFDAEDRPVGELEVCLSCGQLAQRPKVRDLGGDLFPHEEDAFRALCKELGLGGCFLGAREYEDGLAERSAGDGGAPPPTADRSLPVPPARRLADATDEERRRLCLWYSNEAAASAALRSEIFDERGFECPNGDTGTFRRLDWASCVATFPRCDATVEDVSACVRWRVATALCPDPSLTPNPCRNVDACTWGGRRTVRARK